VQKIKDSNNAVAIKVKLADLEHNSDTWRLEKINDAVLRRLEKYKKAKSILEG